MEIGPILQRAWQIVWKHKILFVFSLLQYLVIAPIFLVNLVDPSTLAEWLYQANFLWLYILIVLAWSLLAMVVAAFGMTAVIRGAVMAKDRTEPLKFGFVFQQSLPYFPRLLGILGLCLLAGMLVGGMFGCLTVVASIATMGLGMLCLMPLFLILFLVLLAAGVWVDLSIVAAAAGEKGVFAAFGSAWELIRRNAGRVTILALILVFGRLFLLGIVAVPYYLLSFTPLLSLGGQIDALLVTRISSWAMVAYFPILALGQAAVTTYLYAAWTDAFLTLSPRPAAAAVSETQQGALP
jgi:hypothetical protein